MALTINIYYKGKNGSALNFAKEMINSGIVDQIRNEKGNLKYQYYTSLDDKETILLVDQWESQESLDFHHQSEIMKKIILLRDKYDLTMEVHRYIEEESSKKDLKYIRK